MYARNLLKALDTLDDKDKPFIDVYCRSMDAFEDLKKHTGYPYLNSVIIRDDKITKKTFRKMVKFFFGYNFSRNINMFKLNSNDKLIFPYGFGSEINKLVYWRPDFQEKYFPEFFPKKMIREREGDIRSIAKRGIPIVFSSYACENDFMRFYPEYHTKTFVVHFAVSHKDFTHVSINELRNKYGIRSNYILCANQFWKHKNHLFLIKAYGKALKMGFKMQLVCTGHFSDKRNPEYIKEVFDYIKDNNLSDDVVLPGLINSDELHCLMKNSYAVIQPSLFEGWNTTVEDCKALNKFVFLSDLPVHHEQVKENVCFFNPYDEDDLVDKLINVKPTSTIIDYSYCIKEFGEMFLRIINYVVEQNEK